MHPAIKYKVQKDKKYYLVIVPQENDYGEFTVTIDCPHDRTHVENKAIKNMFRRWLYRRCYM